MWETQMQQEKNISLQAVGRDYSAIKRKQMQRSHSRQKA